MKAWKLFWDIAAVIVGLFLFWQVFTYSGKTIPTFGYFPIGIILGAIGMGIGAVITHLFEGLLGALAYKLFGIRLSNKLMLD